SASNPQKPRPDTVHPYRTRTTLPLRNIANADITVNLMVSHFYAYISKLRWIVRWGLKRNTIQENVMEHSWEVATIAHALAIVRKRCFGGDIDPNAVATAALYHDCSEV